jgi:ATP-binding cassette, subfamily B, bacterial PglK|tara:strand:- start:17373 stop:19172 length:1800 start_codon:yes stop_codon:yes gene_type:complete
MNDIKKIFRFLSIKERKQAFFLIVLLFIMAIFDMIGVASILPFMAVLTNPDVVETNEILNYLFNFSKVLGVNNKEDFLFALGISVFILLVTSLTFKAFTMYIQLRFTQLRQFSIGKRLVENYLDQSYSWFLNRHSAELEKKVLSEVTLVVNNAIKPIIELIAKSFLTLGILLLLILIDPKLAFIVFIVLSFSYGVIYKLTRGFLNNIGEESMEANRLRFKSINEAFNAIKEIKIGGLEDSYVDRFKKSAKVFALHQASSAVLVQLPRFALEALAFGGILLVTIYLLDQSGEIVNVIPIISLYAFSGYRLMPAIQQIYSSVSQLRFVGPVLDSLSNDLRSLKKINSTQQEKISKMPLNNSINLQNINFNYPKSSKKSLRDINLKIDALTTLGIVGSTGCGKTTLVDIILALLEAQEGSLEVDGKTINNSNRKSWQRSIGYVPQQIYLSDDSIESNIAFGIDHSKINLDFVKEAAKIANLHNFVMNELPHKYQTIIGERGIRLSGGQRQRIGIARAIYHKPSVLILDEATSALDNLTEHAVMEAINSLNKKITIIVIAHRLSTIKNCNSIVFLDKGEIKAKGTYEELLNTNDYFRKSVKKL